MKTKTVKAPKKKQPKSAAKLPSPPKTKKMPGGPGDMMGGMMGPRYRGGY